MDRMPCLAIEELCFSAEIYSSIPQRTKFTGQSQQNHEIRNSTITGFRNQVFPLSISKIHMMTLLELRDYTITSAVPGVATFASP